MCSSLHLIQNYRQTESEKTNKTKFVFEKIISVLCTNDFVKNLKIRLDLWAPDQYRLKNNMVYLS